MKKILITGYKGFIGQNLVKELSLSYILGVYEWGEKFPDLDYYDWVIHLGAISSTTEKDVEKVMSQNYDFSIELFEKCIAKKINIQYSSSASVYGNSGSFKETGKVDPKSPYAWSKYFIDRWVEKNIPSTSLIQGFRYFNVYGPHEDHKQQQASPFHKFRKQFERTGTIEVFKGSDQFKRDFVPVSKVTEVHRAFLSVPESGIWNIGTGKAISFLEVAKSISENIVEIDFPENIRSQYQSYTCSDNSKIISTAAKYNIKL